MTKELDVIKRETFKVWTLRVQPERRQRMMVTISDGPKSLLTGETFMPGCVTPQAMPAQIVRSFLRWLDFPKDSELDKTKANGQSRAAQLRLR
jgi:hypothetical protein